VFSVPKSGFWILLAGNREMRRAPEFVQEFLDPELGLEVPGVGSGQAFEKTRIAVLCSPAYSLTAPLDHCVHWMPGWLGNEIDDVEDKDGLVQGIIEESRQSIENKMKVLRRRKETESEEMIRSTLQADLEELHLEKENLCEMLRQLWSVHNIIAKPVLADGNCGVHTALAFQENVSASVIAGKAANSADIDQIVAATRLELCHMWQAVSDDLLWQQIWQRFLEGRVDLRHWQAYVEREVYTPSPRKNKKRSQDVTPENPDGPKKTKQKKSPDAKAQRQQGKLLEGEGVEVPEAQIVVSADQDTKPKKKRDGKKLPPEQTHTYERAFFRFLAEKGLTDKRFLDPHRKKLGCLVCLVCAKVAGGTKVFRMVFPSRILIEKPSFVGLTRSIT
jgi:hypothetical protein